MLFTPAMADAFGDWLEREQIQQALVAARPELVGRMLLDEHRPSIRISVPGSAEILVAKTHAEPVAAWLIGVRGPAGPTLLEAESLGDLVSQVLEMLDSRSRAEGVAQRPA